MPAYNEKIRDHYANPRNTGAIEHTAARAIVRSPVDSDTVQITLQIENGIVGIPNRDHWLGKKNNEDWEKSRVFLSDYVLPDQ